MTTETKQKEIKKIDMKRDKNGILVFNDLTYIVNKLQGNTNYNYELKKLLVENLYENIKFISKKEENKQFFNNIGINENMSLENKRDIDILFDFLTNLIKISFNTHNDFHAITFAFYNHLGQEHYRENLYKKDEIVSKKEIIDSTFLYFNTKWRFLVDDFK